MSYLGEFRTNWRALAAAVLDQMDGDRFIGQTLEIERDPHPIGGG